MHGPACIFGANLTPFSPKRSSGGELAPDPKLWPSGLDHTVSYVHSLGLGFGLYGDRGATRPGRRSHSTWDWQQLPFLRDLPSSLAVVGIG